MCERISPLGIVAVSYTHLYQLTGEFVYGFIELSDFALPIAAMAGAVLYALIFLLSLIPFILNKVLHRKRQNSN